MDDKENKNIDRNLVDEETIVQKNESQKNETMKNSFFNKENIKYRFTKNYISKNFHNIWKKYLMFISIIAIVLVIDLVTKSIFDMKQYEIINGFISIDGFAHNTGAAFSIFSNATVFLLILSIICIILYFLFEYLTMDNNRGYLYYISTSLMVAGTLGNMIDRIAFGYVRDFIKLEFIDFPIFNFADCALTVGVILLAIWLLFIESKEGKNAKVNV